MNKIKVAIIGFGRMGITHLSIINSNPLVEVVAVVDKSSIVLSILKKYLKRIKTYSDYNELFNNEKLDAIIICTPPAFHYRIAIVAAEKNVHVFCEKPFTTKYSEGIELSDRFEKLNLVNQVGYVNRFNDVFRKTKEILESNILGNVIRFKSEMYSKTITNTGKGNTWRDSSEGGGGAIFEVASHAIDLVNYLIGQPKKIIGSSLTSIYSKNVEDAVNATFLYSNRKSGTLNVNWSDESYRKPTNKIELLCEKGKILADQHGLKIFLQKENSKYNFNEGWNSLYITDVFKPVPFYVRGNEFTSQLYNFIDCIKDPNKSNLCTFRNASETLFVIEEIFKDYKQNARSV